jgi:hypothetical protein
MNTFRLRVQALAALGLASLSLPALSADPPIRSQRVQFAKGASSAVVTGRIRGYEVVDYLVNARQGQVANISLATKHTATYFNLMAPGKTRRRSSSAPPRATSSRAPCPTTATTASAST